VCAGFALVQLLDSVGYLFSVDFSLLWG